MTDALNRDSIRVLFAGGGTGGHLMPGAATAEALRRVLPSARSLFLVSERKAERQCVPALAGFETAHEPAAPREGALDKVLFPARSLRAAGRALDVVRGFRPHVIVGLGGLRSIGPALIGRALGIRTVLFEANAIPGAAVRLLAPVADCVMVQWARAADRMKARRVVAAGNPVRSRLFEGRREPATRRLGLAPGRRTLLVLGGSQGALSLNHTVHEALRLIYAKGGDLQVLHLTGVDHLPAALEWMNSLPAASYRPIGFFHQMEDAYAAADFVLSRCGASTLAELTALGLPSILVPYPHAAAGHQSANAEVLRDAGAALVIAQGELTAERLAQAVLTLASDEGPRAQMAECARRLGRPRAALTVAVELAVMAGFGAQVSPSVMAVTSLERLRRHQESVSTKPLQAA